MKQLLNRIERFLLHNTVWIFLAGVLFISNTMLHQQEEQEWSSYGYYILRIGFLFSPILLFVGFRRQIKNNLNLWGYRLLWAFCFLAYVPLLFGLQVDHWLAGGQYGELILNMSWFLFLCIEGALQLAQYFSQQKNRLWKLLKYIKLEQALLVFIGLFAPFYVIFAWLSGEAAITDASFLRLLGYAFQMLLLLLIYYAFYLINHYFLITRLLKRKGVVYFILGFLATLMIFYPIAAQLIAWLPMVQQTQIHPLNYNSVFDEINFGIPFMGMLLSIPFILAIQWYRQSSQLARLSQEKSETELSLLRQQVNPHFFFNTLNNLYALSLRKDPATPEVVLQLSELMRYVIYRGKEEAVPLAEEVGYIKDYVKLQQIRLHKKLDYRFVKNIEDEEVAVPPLLFITLVENAFKHGVEPAEGNCYLYLSLESCNGHLKFTCENSVEEWEDKSRGIGLQNLRRRLNLLFPGQKVLKLEKGNDYYRASMEFLNV